MDLPTCPACGQSVLDDDADECPFCGASMSGSPTSTATKPALAAAPKASPVKTAAAPSAPAKPVRTATAPSEQKVASDDPFELERSAEAKKKVVQLRRQPERGRRHEVKCPMCETIGYTGRKAAGMDVKCANPDCKFPFFTAPPLDESEETPDEKPAEERQPAAGTLLTPMQMRIVAYSVIGVVAAFAFWWFAWRKPTHSTPSGGPATVPNPTTEGGPTKSGAPPIQNDAVKPNRPNELQTIQKNALELMVTHSGQTLSRGLKPLAWQWTVDAYARAGDFDGAKENMQRLRVVTSDGPFYRTLPLVATAWKHMERGTPANAEAGKQALDEALAAAKRLPRRLRQRYDIASQLAAALLAAGRGTEAAAVLEDNDTADAAAQASLFVQRVRFLENYDAAAALRNRRIDVSQSPPRVAVTVILAGHGRWKQAWDWAKSQSAGPVRDDCLIAWAEMQAARKSKVARSKVEGRKDLQTLDQAAAQLSGPAARGTLYARAAFRLHDRKKAVDARAALAKAHSALKPVEVVAEPKPPAVKDVSTFAVTLEPERRNRRATACALAELARADLRLDPHAGKAATPLSRALAVARSIAPSPVAIAGMDENARNGNDSVARNALARITGLDGDDLNNKVIEYRNHLKPIKAAATYRFDLEQRLLVAAANWGGDAKSPAFLQHIWKDVDARTQKNSSGQENWYATSVPWLLAGNATIAGATQLADNIKPRIARRKIPSRRQFVWGRFQVAMRNKQFDEAASNLFDRQLDSNWVNETVLAQAARFADAGDLDSGKRFIRALHDPLLKMHALNLLAARATARGQAKEVWAAANGDSLNSPQRVAMCHGLVVAMPIPEPKPVAKVTK